MSFLDSLIDIGKSAIGFFTGNSLGSQLAKTALTGYALNKINKSINKQNEIPTGTAVDPGVRLQVNPDPEYKVPVVYGEATLGGAVTDAQMAADGQIMAYCLTICEKTGKLNLGQGADSSFEFLEVYWDDNRIVMNDDGYTVKGYVDKAGVFCDTIGGQVLMFFYNGNSNTPVNLRNFANPNTPAYSTIPNWTSANTMDDLIFATVIINYNAERQVRGLGNVKFKVRNSMTQPGDCLYDYMTNTRYGAGIDPQEIFSA
jgi:hypothetical protein